MKRNDRPNVVLISMDATRADHLSCYGYARQTSPELDRLAEDSVLYEKAISPACWTLPSHASMFTGLHVSQHGTHFGNQVLNEQVMTLAEALKGQGYQTVGYPVNAWLDRAFGFNRGFDTYPLRSPAADCITGLGRAGVLAIKISERLYTSRHGRPSKRTLDRVRKWFSHRYSRSEPFFLFALFADPHLPHSVHPHTERFLGDRVRDAKKVNQDPHRYIVGRVEMTDEDFELLAGRYDGEIAFMDQQIGELLSIIGDYASLGETLVVITSDHGENLGDHGLMAHQYCLYDTLIHVPLIIRFPESQGLRGKRVKEQVQTNEILTTVLDVAGISRSVLPQALGGRALLPDEITAGPLPFAVSEELAPNFRRIRRLFPGFDCSRYDRQLRSLRTDEYKYIWASDGRHELFHIQEDPREILNLAEERPETARSMQNMLDGWLASIGEAKRATTEAEYDEAIEDRLRVLGYL